MERQPEIPCADIYFIGFGDHNQSCSIEIMDLFEQLECKRYALFLTCGFIPAQRYKETLKRNLEVWFPESGEFLDMVACQGKVEEKNKEVMYHQSPKFEEEMRIMLEDGNSHPNEMDLQKIENFVKKIQSDEDHRIPIW